MAFCINLWLIFYQNIRCWYLTLCMLGNFYMLLLSPVDFFKNNFLKKSFGNIIIVLNIFIQIRTDSFVCLFDLILYVPSTIFQLNRDGSSWVEPVLS